MSKYYWLNNLSRDFLKKWYLVWEQTAEERILEIWKHAEKVLGIVGFCDKFVNYMSLGYYSLSTPIWCNYWNDRWLEISCYGSNISDNIESILYTQAEVGMMSKFWWWTSWYFGQLRPRWAKIKNNWESSGAVHFMQLFKSITDVISQGSSRRWAFTPYLDIEHSDIKEFLKIWTEWNPIQNMTTGVCVSSDWLKSMVKWDEDKREIWAEVLKTRSEIGYPYIFFKDNVNDNKPQWYENKTIYHTNLCSEIALPNNENESFVCCLSSINLLHWDEIVKTDAIEILFMFLDGVMSEFIRKLENFKWDKKYFMQRALNFAKRHRAIWLGVLGWHSYLQKNMIPFASDEAMELTKTIFSKIKERTGSATRELASIYWEAEVCKWYGVRNATTMAIAPTTSSAFILGQVSQSIEPYMSNYFVKDTAKAKVTFQNPYLKDLLVSKSMDTQDVWNNIKSNDWSVQYIDWLTDKEKEVFKTFAEIDQAKIIDQASIRQKYIDQWQSLNILLPWDASVKEINRLHLLAWESGIKWLYYQHSFNKAQEVKRKISCVWCEA